MSFTHETPDWPVGKLFGDLTPAQKKAVAKRAVVKLGRELQSPEVVALLESADVAPPKEG